MFNISAWLYLKKVSRSKDKDDFWAAPYHRLMVEQIMAILDIIDEELVRSFHYGLKISRDHVVKEKAAALSILNGMGELRLIPKRCDFDNVMRIFSELLGELMKNESEFYFQKLSKEGKVRTMYTCHLEAVRARILNAIYSGQLPFTKKFEREKD